MGRIYPSQRAAANTMRTMVLGHAQAIGAASTAAVVTETIAQVEAGVPAALEPAITTSPYLQSKLDALEERLAELEA